MSRFLKVGLALMVSTAFYAAPTSAADLDLPSPPVIEHTPVVASAGGFYLRGDIGYSIWQDPDFSDTVGNPDGDPWVNVTSDNTLIAGVGVGYKFRKYLRADITFDIGKGKDIDGLAPCGACIAPGNPGFTRENVNLSSYTTLANAYFDIGEFRRFTPYVGAGIGFSFLDFGRLISSDNPPTQDPVSTFRTDDRIALAWALHAGASYAVNDNLSLDASYRFLNVDGGQLFDVGFGTVDYEDLRGHEVRLGFRYTFGGSEPTYEAPQPIFK